ncbi:MAG: leucyl aminopeptidase [Pseudomonadota bacterium]
MEVKFTKLERALKADTLVLPFIEGAKEIETDVKLKRVIKPALALKDTKGKKGEVSLFYPDREDVPKRIFLVGLGKKEELNTEPIRQAYAAVAKKLVTMKIDTASVVVPEIACDEISRGKRLSPAEIAGAVAEGLSLADYVFDKYMTPEKEEDKYQPLKSITFVGNLSKGVKETVREKLVIADAVKYARDLQNDTADLVCPEYLAHQAKTIAKEHGLKCTVFDKKKIEKLGMGLLLAVNRGSNLEPRFIVLEYKGDPKSKDKTVILGKGLTFDSGGYNLKPTKFIETMREDMSGAAVTLGTIKGAARLKLKKNLVGVIPATENMIGSRAYKPGDIYPSMSGKTVEIGSTDAEGRLILADAITYIVQKIKPARIIDFATLTGAILITFGDVVIGAMTNDDKIYETIYKAGEATYERVWRLPIYDEYRELLKSDIADIKNLGGRPAGSITAAAFLEKFVEGTPWLHLDIAGVSWLEKERHYIPKNGTGTGIRLMIEFLKRM